jgi:hypothetical protein
MDLTELPLEDDRLIRRKINRVLSNLKQYSQSIHEWQIHLREEVVRSLEWLYFHNEAKPL